MVKDLRGHEVPAGGDGWAYREDMEQLSRTVNDVVTVANAEGRAALIEELAASEDGVPGVVLVSRADAPAGSEIEYSTDGGTTWVPLVGETGGRTLTVLPADAFAAADTPDAYPMGTSAFVVSAGTGWPMSTGLVETRKFTADRLQQIFHGTSSRAYYRSGNAGAWASSWRGEVGPFAVAAGGGTISAVSGTKSTIVSLPSGLFTEAPDVTLGPRTAFPQNRSFMSASGATATNFTAYIYYTPGSGTPPDLAFSWTAVQMTG